MLFFGLNMFHKRKVCLYTVIGGGGGARGSLSRKEGINHPLNHTCALWAFPAMEKKLEMCINPDFVFQSSSKQVAFPPPSKCEVLHYWPSLKSGVHFSQEMPTCPSLENVNILSLSLLSHQQDFLEGFYENRKYRPWLQFWPTQNSTLVISVPPRCYSTLLIWLQGDTSNDLVTFILKTPSF